MSSRKTMSLESFFATQMDDDDTPYADEERERAGALARMGPQSIPASAGHFEGLHVGDYQAALDAIRAWASPASVTVDGDSIVATAESWGIALRIEIDVAAVQSAGDTAELVGRRNSTLEIFLAAMGQATNAVLAKLDEVTAAEQRVVAHSVFDVVPAEQRDSAALLRAQKRSGR